MKCPRRSCHSYNNRTTKTMDADTPRMPVELHGLNITRRIHVCNECGTRFTTIEMLEEDFNELKRPPGRLDLSPTLRP